LLYLKAFEYVLILAFVLNGPKTGITEMMVGKFLPWVLMMLVRRSLPGVKMVNTERCSIKIVIIPLV